MKKYLTITALSFQKQLEVRSDFLFERTRSLSVLISMYYLWSALLANRTDLLGYHRDQLLTYVLIMTLLRALVLGCVTDRIPSEIAKGNLSDILLRPVRPIGYWAAQDAASKVLNLSSAVLEFTVFAWLVSAPVLLPSGPAAWLGFAASTAGGMILYFQMSYLLGVLGFWTSQSWGPRFCFEIVLEFCGGAYFPIDLLPAAVQKVLNLLPFPYLVFHPISIYLGRTETSAIPSILARQAVWIILLGFLSAYVWNKGLRRYAAEGR